jgi:hypothetical protein
VVAHPTGPSPPRRGSVDVKVLLTPAASSRFVNLERVERAGAADPGAGAILRVRFLGQPSMIPVLSIAVATAVLLGLIVWTKVPS